MRSFVFKSILIAACGLPAFARSADNAAACALGYRSFAESPLAALDAYGNPTAAVNIANGQVPWITNDARRLIAEGFGDFKTTADGTLQLPAKVSIWLQDAVASKGSRKLKRTIDDREIVLEVSQKPDNAKEPWLLVVREVSQKLIREDLKREFGLTPKETEVLYWIVQGKQQGDIGEILGISPLTAKKHVENILRKMGVSSKVQATVLAIRRVPRLGD